MKTDSIKKLNDTLKIKFALDKDSFEGNGQVININGTNYKIVGKGILEKL